MPRGRVHPVIDRAIGRRLRIVRRARGVTQRHLAGLLGVAHQQVNKYEDGSSRMAASQLIQICRIFNVSLDYFLRDLPAEFAPRPRPSEPTKH